MCILMQLYFYALKYVTAGTVFLTSKLFIILLNAYNIIWTTCVYVFNYKIGGAYAKLTFFQERKTFCLLKSSRGLLFTNRHVGISKCLVVLSCGLMQFITLLLEVSTKKIKVKNSCWLSPAPTISLIALLLCCCYMKFHQSIWRQSFR